MFWNRNYNDHHFDYTTAAIMCYTYSIALSLQLCDDAMTAELIFENMNMNFVSTGETDSL